MDIGHIPDVTHNGARQPLWIAGAPIKSYWMGQTDLTRSCTNDDWHRGIPLSRLYMRIALNILGVLCLLIGCVWLLQGINILRGSIMSGQTKWTLYGGLVAVAGIGLLFAANRRRG